MKHLFTVSLFAMGLVLSSTGFAATGTGHAQAELSFPLTVENYVTIDFGTIAVDPGAGPQTIVSWGGGVFCPETYVCTGTFAQGWILVTGGPYSTVNVDITGSTAILSDGNGHEIVFDPTFANDLDTNSRDLQDNGFRVFGVLGSISLTGNEPAGTYNTTNAGGSGYQVTVNY